ncbi:peptidase [Flavobacterium salilacus subsp. salilacus]|uniref:murein L,D-transpeptidase catalytic domain-containing protein n=1 Tax=Flavobacterium TaxID=237 RepID=UPI001074F059|nr:MULTISPECIES: murein L,D-transpeptidase catalytic domain family protein [Flavobacterium]KAF2519729.1 peptidase [Flavobacterium salilacus subsp. salilacus]MBE1614381.1 murein L,D-transpeptidase catalytic domain family protein [Flavobacterium sp. SaA2.13]
MIRAFILLLISFFSCADSPKKGEVLPEKDYAATHNEALKFCKEKGMCTDYYFLIDMSIHSGKNRFYVYSFDEGKITDKNVVTHGSCDAYEPNDTKYQKAKFSNRAESHCTSKGKYKVGSRDYSSWGINVKYWLHGLEESNSNAKDRVVVLHSWDAVPDVEIYPTYSPLSWGCPAVSDNFMRKLDAKLKQTQKPVLLWITD